VPWQHIEYPAWEYAHKVKLKGDGGAPHRQWCPQFDAARERTPTGLTYKRFAETKGAFEEPELQVDMAVVSSCQMLGLVL